MIAYIPEDIRKEEANLIQIMLSSPEELTMEEFVEKYASEKYKTYLQNERKREDGLWEQGIIEN